MWLLKTSFKTVQIWLLDFATSKCWSTYVSMGCSGAAVHILLAFEEEGATLEVDQHCRAFCKEKRHLDMPWCDLDCL